MTKEQLVALLEEANIALIRCGTIGSGQVYKLANAMHVKIVMALSQPDEPEADRCGCGRFYEQRCPVCGPVENRGSGAMIVTNVEKPTPIDCGCGNMLFEVQPGRFEFYAGTIECSKCHEVHDICGLLARLPVNREGPL